MLNFVAEKFLNQFGKFLLGVLSSWFRYYWGPYRLGEISVLKYFPIWLLDYVMLNLVYIQICRKISINVQVSNREAIVASHVPAWEKLDLELIKRERLQREVSLAEQIRAAKTKKAMAASSHVSPIPRHTRGVT